MTLESQLSNETDSHLEQITHQAFEVLAGLSADRCFSAPGPQHNSFVALVAYGESTWGALLIEVEESLAYGFTSRLMQIREPTTLDSDVVDALGELANTIGGNFKGLLDMEIILSTPSVSTLEEFHTRYSDLKIFRRVACGLSGSSCVVSLVTATKNK